MLRFIAGLMLLIAAPFLYDEGSIAALIGIVGVVLFAYGTKWALENQMEETW